jgi:hypothetical protein
LKETLRMTARNRDWIVGVGVEVRLTGGDTNGCRRVWSKNLVDYGYHGLPTLVGLSRMHGHTCGCSHYEQAE